MSNLPKKIENNMLDFIMSEIEKFPEFNITDTVSEYIERERTISSGLTARPGNFTYKTTPYLREIINNQSDSSPIQETYVIKATQVGFTVGVLESDIAYKVRYGIGPLLMVGADQAMMEEQVEKRVDEMIEACGLQDFITPNVIKKKGKATGDRKDAKSYGGTFMRAVGSNSESKLRSFPARILHLDEIDIYPMQIVKNGDSTGDTIEKALRRTDSFGNLKKIIAGSTPKSESTSRILPKFEEGDERYYNIRCPECNHQHPLIFKNFKWDKKEDGSPDIRYTEIEGHQTISHDPTYFECPECKRKIKEIEKFDLLQELGHGGTAEWVATSESVRPFVRSYSINAFYGFRSFIDILLQWIRVKDDPFLLPTFINDTLAEVYKESNEKPVDHELMQLSQRYELWNIGEISENVLYLTASVDVQKDRLEFMLMGQARDKQMYVIDYKTFQGNPAEIEDQCWKDLYDSITKTYIRKDGQEMFVKIALIDSQYLTSTVEDFCEQFPYDHHSIDGVYPLRSQERQDKLVKFAKSNIETPSVSIDDQAFKRALYTTLSKRPINDHHFPSSYMHISKDFGEEFFKQLTSEEIFITKIKGVVKGYSIENRKQRRNETLDLSKYNMAAHQLAIQMYFEILNENLKLDKRKEQQQSSTVFFDFIEESLYS